MASKKPDFDDLDPPPKGGPDWGAIERAFRHSQESPKKLAARFNADASAITRRAKEEGWARDLSGMIRTRAAERILLPNHVSPLATELKAAVETAAMDVASVAVAHRKQLTLARLIVTKLLEEIVEGTFPPNIRAQSVVALSGAMKNLISLERQAFAMDAEAPPTDDAIESLTPEQRRAALALIFARP